MDRRRFLGYFTAAGLGATLLPGVLYALTEKEGQLTKETLAEAERIAGLSFTDAERELMLRDLQDTIAGYDRLRAIPLANAAAPALGFDPTRGGEGGGRARRAPALADESVDLARLSSHAHRRNRGLRELAADLDPARLGFEPAAATREAAARLTEMTRP